MLHLKVKVNYPTDPLVLKQLDERAARALVIALRNELPPQKIDELIEELKQELKNNS